MGSLSDVIRGKNKTLKAAEESNIVINKPKPIKMNKGLKSAGAKGKKNPKHGNMGVHRAAELSSLRLCFADIIYLTLGCARYVIVYSLPIDFMNMSTASQCTVVNCTI